MRRRQLFSWGFGALGAALVGAGVAWWQPGLVQGRLSVEARALWLRVAEAVLDGSLPTAPEPRALALAQYLLRLESTLAGLPPATRAELSDLCAVLATAPGRWVLMGVRSDWQQLPVQDLQAALQAMRGSPHAWRRQSYQALRDLTNAAYFADPSTWTALGYPGPREVGA